VSGTRSLIKPLSSLSQNSDRSPSSGAEMAHSRRSTTRVPLGRDTRFHSWLPTRRTVTLPATVRNPAARWALSEASLSRAIVVYSLERPRASAHCFAAATSAPNMPILRESGMTNTLWMYAPDGSRDTFTTWFT